jgi:hypothetical protein
VKPECALVHPPAGSVVVVDVVEVLVVEVLVVEVLVVEVLVLVVVVGRVVVVVVGRVVVVVRIVVVVVERRPGCASAPGLSTRIALHLAKPRTAGPHASRCSTVAGRVGLPEATVAMPANTPRTTATLVPIATPWRQRGSPLIFMPQGYWRRRNLTMLRRAHVRRCPC